MSVSPRDPRRDDEALSRMTVKSFYKLCEAVASPVALSCWLKAKYGEWDQLVLSKVDPLAYDDPHAFALDYQCVSALAKADFLPTTFDRREAARQTFWEAERLCAETNERLELYSKGRLMPSDLRVHAVLHRARELIRRILGEAPNPAVEPEFRFGPGATSLVKRYITAAEKYRRHVDVTPSLYPFWRDVAGPRWVSHIESVSLNACNKVSFVPKNAKTFRAIAIEPHLNGYAQLGIASLIRKRLKTVGIDLATQADVNRAFASMAESWDLATIDLSSASDTVSRELVWLLLPESWASLLDTVRSPYGELDGVQFEYAKFSSMGNGCTFELETLIFYALARASGASRAMTQVFGDDIVCESSCVPLLRAVLWFAGFVVNEGKTFSTGPFRESCGHDYYRGVNVRPFFWKDLDVPLWFKVCNDLRSLSRNPRLKPDGKALVKAAWLSASRTIPRHLDCRVPPGYESYGIVDRPSAPYREIGRDDGWEAVAFRGVVFQPTKIAIHQSYQAYLACLDGNSYDGTGETSFRGMGYWKKTWITHVGEVPRVGDF